MVSSLSLIQEQSIGCEATLHLTPVPSTYCRVRSAASEDNDAIRLLGLSYRSADTSLRSRAALSGEKLERFLGLLREYGVAEAVVLSTCNRTEVYTFGGASHQILASYVSATGVAEDELEPHLYRKSNVCVACHLFRVASGLDSAVLGETEIVAQVKSAWRESGFSGSKLDLLFQRALEASKRVRTETALCKNVTSLSVLAVREAGRVRGPLKDRNVVVIGAGQFAERIGKELQSVGASKVKVLNRTVENARLLADRFGFQFGELAELEDALADADVVFATATAPSPIVTSRHVSSGARPLVIDLGIPRNVEAPELETLNVDALASQCAENAEARNAAIPAAMNVLEAELEKLEVSLKERRASSTIRGLVQHGEAVRQQTLGWALDQLPDLSAKERRVFEDLARRMVIGMLTPPIEELKKGSLTPQERAAVERVFRLSTKEQAS